MVGKDLCCLKRLSIAGGFFPAFSSSFSVHFHLDNKANVCAWGGLVICISAEGNLLLCPPQRINPFGSSLCCPADPLRLSLRFP